MSTLILFYHSVHENLDRRIDPSIVVSPENFEWQLAYFADRHRVIALDDYVNALHSGRSLPSNNVIITFDDGYKDNFETVYPLLVKYKIPATFFLATDYIDGKTKWEDRISFALFNTSVEKITVCKNGSSATFQLFREQGRNSAMRSLIRWLNTLTSNAQMDVLLQIYQQCGMSLEDYPSEPTMLTWDDVREMASTPWIAFGCHTVSHRRLTTLSDEELEREIRLSKHKIEQETSRRVRLFSYPSGTRSDFDERAQACLRSYGFDCGLTTLYLLNGPHSNPYRLGRVIGANTSRFRFRFGNSVRGSIIGESVRLAVKQWREFI